MLKRSLRLTKSSDFARIYRFGQKFQSLNLRLFFFRNKHNLSRFGFVVSKKQVSKIVTRNRVKRILRNEILASQKYIRPGFDILVLGKSGILKLSGAKLREELRNILKKTKLFANHE